MVRRLLIVAAVAVSSSAGSSQSPAVTPAPSEVKYYWISYDGCCCAQCDNTRYACPCSTADIP